MPVCTLLSTYMGYLGRRRRRDSMRRRRGSVRITRMSARWGFWSARLGESMGMRGFGMWGCWRLLMSRCRIEIRRFDEETVLP